VSKIIYTPWLY